MMHLMPYQRPSRGVDPGDIRGNSAEFSDRCRQFLARDGGIGMCLHFRGKMHGERPAGFVTSPLSWKWKIRTAGTGYYRWTASRQSVLFCWSSFPNIAQEIYDLFHANLLMIRCWIFILSSVWIIHILLTIYIIVKLLLKIIQEITLQLGIPFKLCSPG